MRQEIERRTGRRVARGAVYITLDRLESKGLMSSAQADKPDATGRRRRSYRVSLRGVRALKHTWSALDQMREGLEPLLGKA